MATFIKQGISGDMLLEDEAIDEMLEELGVESAIEKLKIKVFAIVQGFEFVILPTRGCKTVGGNQGT